MAETAFPLRVSGSGRYLETADGQPFLLHGDTAWSLIVGGSLADAERYLDDRAARGFTATIVNLVERCFAPDPPRTMDGIEPFEDVPRTSARCVPSTWTVRPRSSGRPGSAACSCCCAPPTWATWTPTTRATRAGPRAGTTSSSRSRSRRCGTTAVAWPRPWRTSTMSPGCWPGIACPARPCRTWRPWPRASARSHRDALFTAHVHPGRRPLESFPWLDLNQVYSYGIVHRRVHDEHRLEPPRPCILFESTYENEGDSTRLQLRQQSWWAMLGGACGQCFGNKPVWGAFPGWLEALDSPGAQDQARFASFLGEQALVAPCPGRRAALHRGWGRGAQRARPDRGGHRGRRQPGASSTCPWPARSPWTSRPCRRDATGPRGSIRPAVPARRRARMPPQDAGPSRRPGRRTRSSSSSGSRPTAEAR